MTVLLLGELLCVSPRCNATVIQEHLPANLDTLQEIARYRELLGHAFPTHFMPDQT
jgi:hypothetical protein